MNATQEIKINDVSHEETAWKRYIYFQHDGNDYELTLYWDEFNGYETYWSSPNQTPDWVTNWNESEHKGMSFQWYLDELTYNIK